MTGVRFEHISKSFGGLLALADVDFAIAPGELFFLLGPSGCGKSTLLRLVAGLLEPSRGRVFFDDRDVTAVDTRNRNAVMVFQSYALWPHMTVRQNVGFGLSVRGVAADAARRQVEAALELVHLTAEADRKPAELSGGQQQRVALARAMAVRPACLLLDEPLSNLDAKLRLQMRSDIRRICKEGGFTTIYVTHDQKEALSIADRIAVMQDGRVRQIGTPAELYGKPQNSFVADFIGQANLLKGRVVANLGGFAQVHTGLGDVLAPDPDQLAVSSTVTLCIRPEQVHLSPLASVAPPTGSATAADPINRYVGRVVDSTFLGEASEHTLEMSALRLRAMATPPLFDPPNKMLVSFNAADVQMLSEPFAQ